MRGAFPVPQLIRSWCRRDAGGALFGEECGGIFVGEYLRERWVEIPANFLGMGKL